MRLAVSHLLSQPGLREQGSELVGQSPRLLLPDNDIKRPGVDWRVGIVVDREQLNVRLQRPCQWLNNGLPGLGSHEAEFSRLQVEICPSQLRDIPQSLPGIEPEKYHALPFVVGHREDRANFREGKGPSASLMRQFYRFDEFSGIL